MLSAKFSQSQHRDALFSITTPRRIQSEPSIHPLCSCFLNPQTAVVRSAIIFIIWNQMVYVRSHPHTAVARSAVVGRSPTNPSCRWAIVRWEGEWSVAVRYALVDIGDVPMTKLICAAIAVSAVAWYSVHRLVSVEAESILPTRKVNGEPAGVGGRRSQAERGFHCGLKLTIADNENVRCTHLATQNSNDDKIYILAVWVVESGSLWAVSASTSQDIMMRCRAVGHKLRVNSNRRGQKCTYHPSGKSCRVSSWLC